MPKTRLCLSLASFLLISACGSDDSDPAEGNQAFSSWEGTFHRTAELEDDGCGDAPSAVTQPQTAEFFRLKSKTMLGFTELMMYDCTSATACDESSIQLGNPHFSTQEGDGLAGEISTSASGSGGTCVIAQNTATLEKISGGIEIVITRKSKEIQVDDAQCTLETAEARKAEMACDSKRIIRAEKAE